MEESREFEEWEKIMKEQLEKVYRETWREEKIYQDQRISVCVCCCVL